MLFICVVYFHIVRLGFLLLFPTLNLIYFPVDIPGKKHSHYYTYFGVSGHVVVPRLKSGFRKMVHEDAVETHACHDFRLDQLANTIYYKEAGDDNLYV